MVTKGETGPGKDKSGAWDKHTHTHTHTHTLLYIRQITRKDLPTAQGTVLSIL